MPVLVPLYPVTVTIRSASPELALLPGEEPDGVASGATRVCSSKGRRKHTARGEAPFLAAGLTRCAC